MTSWAPHMSGAKNSQTEASISYDRPWVVIEPEELGTFFELCNRQRRLMASKSRNCFSNRSVIVLIELCEVRLGNRDRIAVVKQMQR